MDALRKHTVYSAPCQQNFILIGTFLAADRASKGISLIWCSLSLYQ
jgi:hypothetical protein